MTSYKSFSHRLSRHDIRTLAVLAVTLCGAVSFAFATGIESPDGRWQTFDDATHRARGVVRIFEREGRWFGRVERPGHPESRCTECTDERKDQPIDGLVIIRNMQPVAGDPSAWDGGDVLDPDTGRIYRLKMHLEEHGSRLVVRGFFGVSLLGRSQTWTRIP